MNKNQSRFASIIDVLKVSSVAFIVSGCIQDLPSVGPSYESPKVMPATFPLPDAGFPTENTASDLLYVPASSNEDTRVEITTSSASNWWKLFNDPILDNLISTAVTNNLSYLVAHKRLEQSNYELLGSYAAFLPAFTVGGDWTRSHFHKNVPAGGYSKTTYNASNVGLDGNWEIDIFGGNRRNTEAKIALAEASAWGVADTRINLVTEIGKQYINLRTMQERISVAETNLALQTETYQILKSRFDSGIGDELAVNQCAYIVEQTRARIPQLIAGEEALKNALAVLAGEIPGALHELLDPPEISRDWIVIPQKVSTMPLDMMRARPDVKIAERRLAAETAYIGVAKAQWFPRLFISGSVGFQTRGSVNLFDKKSFLASIGPSVSWPIFQGGAIYASVKAAEARMDQAALEYALTIEKAYAQIRDAYSAYTQEYHRYQALKAAVKAASDAVTISNDLYKNGLKDFNNVLDAQRSRLQLEEELVVSRGQITLYLIDLYKALGGGLSAD